MEIEIAIALVLLILLTLLASVDMAFSQLSDLSLRLLYSEDEIKQSRVEFLQEISENRPRFRFALSSAIQFLLIGFSVLVVLVVFRYTQESKWMLAYSLVIGLGLSVVFRQLIPRLITYRNPERCLLGLLPLVRPIYSVLPFVAGPLEPSIGRQQFSGSENSITPDPNETKDDDDDSDDIQALMEVGEAEGIIEEDERAMIEKLISFSDTEVDEVMTPRTEIVGISIDATVEEARNLMLEQKFSRLPVYRENIDNIEGVIYVRDLLQTWANGKESAPLKPNIREVFFVPETKSVSDLLESMQKNHVQISVVVDEYGGVAGLVTVEDILEEIVGEIEDEDQETEIVDISDDENGFSRTAGSTEIGKIENYLNLEIEDDDFTTIAGLVTSEAGYVPRKGETLNVRGLEVEILKADGKRIHLLRFRPAKKNTDS